MTHPQSVFIVGTAYSGSSVLGMALHNAAEGIMYVGELSRIPILRQTYKLDLHDGECSACLINQEECPIFSSTQLGVLGKKSPSALHTYLYKQLGAKTLVDASKHPAWLRQFIPDLQAQSSRVIVTVKNPKNYIQSCLDRHIGEPWQAANAWRDTYYDALRTLTRNNLMYYVVCNEDMVLQPAQTTENVQSFLGYSHYKSRSTQPIHAIGGNPAAQVAIFGKQKIQQAAKQLGRDSFDLNPVHGNPTDPQKITFDTQVLFDTPGLSDLANILGYTSKELL
jgi:hypothetical protein